MARFRYHRHIAWAILCAGLSCSSQEFPHQDSSSLKTRTPESRNLTIDTIATDMHGKPHVQSPQDITVSLDGRPIALANVQGYAPGDASPQVIFVLDAMNSTYLELDESVKALRAYLTSANGILPHPTSLLIFSGTNLQSTDKEARSLNRDVPGTHPLFALRTPVTRDGAMLSNALDQYGVGLSNISRSMSGVESPQLVQMSLRALDRLANAELAVAGPKIVIWLSPGWPYQIVDGGRAEDAFGRVMYFSDLLRSARIILFAVSPPRTPFYRSTRNGGSLPGEPHTSDGFRSARYHELGDDYYSAFTHPVRKPRDANPNHLSLQVLALSTGGLVVQNRDDFAAQVARCAQEADAVISFTFTPGPAAEKTTFHDIRAEFPNHEGSLRTRAGFYGK